MTVATPDDLLVHEMRDLLYVENAMQKLLPKLLDSVENEQLSRRMQEHVRETEQHAKNLEQAFEALGQPAKAERCEAFDGIRAEAESLLRESESTDATQLYLAGGAITRMEHYEIAGYRMALELARATGHDDVAQLLEENLGQEQTMLSDAEQMVPMLLGNGNGGASAASLQDRTVDELQQMARELEISGRSDMKRDELLEAVQQAQSSGGGMQQGEQRPVVTGDDSSTQYSQEITSPDEEPEREGRSLVTTNHDVIRQWAEERDAKPATIEGTEHEGRPGVLRFDFPGGSEGSPLKQISWDEWFETFEARKLNFIYQEQRSDGNESNFFRLENPEREDA